MFLPNIEKDVNPRRGYNRSYTVVPMLKTEVT